MEHIMKLIPRIAIAAILTAGSFAITAPTYAVTKTPPASQQAATKTTVSNLGANQTGSVSVDGECSDRGHKAY